MSKIISRNEGRSVFGKSCDAYQAGRPDYPSRIYELLQRRCNPALKPQVFEIGPGTGQATVRLLEVGYNVIAIEPDKIFAEKLIEKFEHQYPRAFKVINSPFEDVSLKPEIFDLGIAATSFHWIDPVMGLNKAFSLLRPGGCFAMWWTVFGGSINRDIFQQKTGHLFSQLCLSPSHEDGYSSPYELQDEKRKEDLKKAGFIDISSEEILWETEMNAYQTRMLVSTFSPVARLDVNERISFLNEIENIVNAEPNGKVNRKFISVIYFAHKPYN